MASRVTWTAVEVLSVVGTSVTVGTPDEYGGMATLVLEPPHVQPHFLPEVGSVARVLKVDNVPFIYPDSIAQDAITAREIVAGAITAEHVTADAIDGKTITGATIRTAASGERFVVNEGGTNPDEIRFYPSTGADFGSMQVETEVGAVAALRIAGPLVTGLPQSNLVASSIQSGVLMSRGAVGLGTARQVKLAAEPLRALISVLDQTTTPDFSAVVDLDTVDLLLDHPLLIRLAAAGADRVVVDPTGVGFNAATPIAVRTVNAAATDLPTAIALLNQIRQWGIDIGFLQ